MKVKDIIKNRNYVAKNSRDMTGAGRHEDKKGKHMKRAKQKAKFRKEMLNLKY